MGPSATPPTGLTPCGGGRLRGDPNLSDARVDGGTAKSDDEYDLDTTRLREKPPES